MNDELARELEYLRQELADARADLQAAAEENADLRAKLQTCQELSGGRLPMSDDAISAGRALIKSLLTIVGQRSVCENRPIYRSVAEAKILLDALRPFFGDGA